MQIFVDADAFPQMLHDVLFRAVERTGTALFMVSNRQRRWPSSPLISAIVTPNGFNAADDRIVELVRPDDLVITADVPLADRVISQGAHALNPRGQLYTAANIKERLAMRNLLEDLRVGGEITGGPAAFNAKNREQFANQLNRLLTRYANKKA